MLPGGVPLPDGLSLRPSRTSDESFLAELYTSTRDDLLMAIDDEEFATGLIGMQQHAQIEGYGDMFPNAMYFIVEKLGERIGRLVLDFGSNEVRIVDLALIRGARGKGLGSQVIQSVKAVAEKVMAPVTLSVNMANPLARQLYVRLGFQTLEVQPPVEQMIWYPNASRIQV